MAGQLLFDGKWRRCGDVRPEARAEETVGGGCGSPRVEKCESGAGGVERWRCALRVPDEPEDVRSDKYYLTAAGMGAGGALYLGGERVLRFAPHGAAEADVTAMVREDAENALELVLDRRGRLPRVGLRCVKFARVLCVQVDASRDGSFCAQIELEAFTRGRYTVKYRLLCRKPGGGTELAASVNMPARLIAARQRLQAQLVPEEGAIAGPLALRVGVERGGVGCDWFEAEVPSPLAQAACAAARLSGAGVYARAEGGEEASLLAWADKPAAEAFDRLDTEWGLERFRQSAWRARLAGRGARVCLPGVLPGAGAGVLLPEWAVAALAQAYAPQGAFVLADRSAGGALRLTPAFAGVEGDDLVAELSLDMGCGLSRTVRWRIGQGWQSGLGEGIGIPLAARLTLYGSGGRIVECLRVFAGAGGRAELLPLRDGAWLVNRAGGYAPDVLLSGGGSCPRLVSLGAWERAELADWKDVHIICEDMKGSCWEK